MVCEWKSDSTPVVLEVPDENEQSKATSDSDKCSWSQLLQEMEDNGVVNPSINSHELLAPVTDGGRGLSNCITVGTSINKHTPNLPVKYYPSLAGMLSSSLVKSVVFVWASHHKVECKILRRSALHHQAQADADLFPVLPANPELEIYQLCQRIHGAGLLEMFCKFVPGVGMFSFLTANQLKVLLLSVSKSLKVSNFNLSTNTHCHIPIYIRFKTKALILNVVFSVFSFRTAGTYLPTR